MKVDKKLRFSEVLTKQSDQVNGLLDKFEIKMTELVEDLSADEKIAFYGKINAIYTDKLNRLQKTTEENKI